VHFNVDAVRVNADHITSRGVIGRRLWLSLLIVSIAWIAASVAGATEYFTFESVRAWMEGDGRRGVLAFTLLFAVAQLLRVPSFVFIAAAVAVYGLYPGVLVGLIGALASALVSFTVVRAVAGQALAEIRLPLFRRLLDLVDDRPIVAIALLRLIFQTAPPLNYALAMTAVRWRDHLIGSFLGLPLPVTVMAFVFDWLGLHGF
jgi:uncharacterized membrane protein YdjX (TVP38/TMEM64 family)